MHAKLFLSAVGHAHVKRHVQVARADKAVEEGNQNRSAMSSSMLARLKKASADYEVEPYCLPCLQK